MALRVSMKELILFGFAISLAWSSHAVERETSISEEEDAELERQLKIINKPVIKVIKTHYGDIYDCVDIYKQPAFDHPLLKNHKIQVYFPFQFFYFTIYIYIQHSWSLHLLIFVIQMRPTSFPKGLFDKASSLDEASNVKSSEIGLKNRCPPGSVPIRRTRKEDLIRVKQSPSDFQPLTDSAPGHHFVKNYVNNVHYHGAGAWIAVYNPTVSNGQFSNAVMWIENGEENNLNSIQVGWTVNHALHGDNRTRLFTYWTVDGYQKTGCFDTRCPGFVQVSTDTALGLVFENTVANEGQPIELKNMGQTNKAMYQIENTFHTVLYIFNKMGFNFLVYYVRWQDLSTGNWWLSFTEDNVHIGYWPKSLFTDLATSASYIKWGAEVYSPSGEASPPMGSGRLPSEGANKASFFNGLQVIYHSALKDPSEGLLTRRKIDNPDCYDADKVKQFGVLDYYFFFGGPGGTNCGN
ncbi:hypothetical protein HHK36_013603 [Tetracentron sinense]|uniref:Neprosin PEP catalytic domain-containing protein n=1 Tax=Tetracentron sinense TaxID=13715 RepID=A0A835DEK7_TETSI|nr:hypothetical protein HHK36_013603 [Tetracentron sinense]